MFSGRECSVCLAKMNFAQELMDPEKNHWKKCLNEQEKGVLEGWAVFFEGKYEVVGLMEDEEEAANRKDE